MNIRLHIDRLVLDGLPLEMAQASAVQAAAEAELARLLAEQGLAAGLRHGGAFASARGAELHLTAPPEPANVGRQIAASIHEGLRR